MEDPYRAERGQTEQRVHQAVDTAQRGRDAAPAPGQHAIEDVGKQGQGETDA
jgi:hypothetical protein